MDELKSLGIDLEALIKDATEKIEKLLQAGFTPEAEILVKQLLRVDPDNLQGLQLYGLILFRQRKYQESIDVLNKALKTDPLNAENHNNIALSYLHSNRNELAKEHINKAMELNCKNHNFVSNKGLIARASNDLKTAIACFKLALTMNPTDAKVWGNMGSALGQQKDLDKAIACFIKSLDLDPDNLGAHVDLAYAYHLKGEWEKAWPEYEHRLKYWHQENRNAGRFYEIYIPERAWDGVASVSGKNLVVYCEQGSGDMIQFMRFVPKLAALGANVIIDAPPELASLFEPFGRVRTDYEDGTQIDYHCSVLSLPYLLKIKDFEGDKPYYKPEKVLNFDDYKNNFKIGIVWAGNPGHPNDANRSVHLSNFKEIYDLPGVKLFSFQRDVSKRVYTYAPQIVVDFAENCDEIKLVDLSQHMKDFKATVGLLNEMDLVVTVDTAVLHLSGAIGKETLALIPYNPDWRWGLVGNETPWYSTVKLFRQETNGDWKSVFDNVRNYLIENYLSNKR